MVFSTKSAKCLQGVGLAASDGKIFLFRGMLHKERTRDSSGSFRTGIEELLEQHGP